MRFRYQLRTNLAGGVGVNGCGLGIRGLAAGDVRQSAP
jgi:hypothetical protein